ncbi:sulfur carrier protein ThiS [Nakamurella flavida]|uniref:Sulfur carrier protein ThiS n=1 Tax=Nakamurella flavida TaxID=363630 RepID=A0A938YDP4_9ACTN|nr:sulfur carrier protein ThiS [Nakamurella flavida]MBM9475776.1 sulfur carrier protein ThiS [Nakamurella flavida]MDP9777944.1 sulfur carrier protein [Nakamurella flavida]
MTPQHPDPTGNAITVNGAARTVPSACTVETLLGLLGLHPDGLAVAVNGSVAPRAGWRRPLPHGAVVDVLSAVPGG